MESANKYSQLDKNTVDSANQLKGSGPVRFVNPEGKGKKVMFIGNSMTLHGISEGIGWHRECGMAASAPEKDYVHILMDKLGRENAYCICQVSGWERQYRTGDALLQRFREAREFGADILILRAIENCPKADFEDALFRAQLTRLLEYLNPKAGKVILTTGFWRHPGDEAIRALAREQNLPLVELGDLGEQEAMKALGLFSHKGVANHPGDAGMAAMAERILPAIL